MEVSFLQKTLKLQDGHWPALFPAFNCICLLEWTVGCCQKTHHFPNYLWKNNFKHWPNVASLRKQHPRREGGRKPEEEEEEKKRQLQGSWKDFIKAPVRAHFILWFPRKTVRSLLADGSAKVREGRKGLYILGIFPSCVVKCLISGRKVFFSFFSLYIPLSFSLTENDSGDMEKYKEGNKSHL